MPCSYIFLREAAGLLSAHSRCTDQFSSYGRTSTSLHLVNLHNLHVSSPDYCRESKALSLTAQIAYDGMFWDTVRIRNISLILEGKLGHVPVAHIVEYHKEIIR